MEDDCELCLKCGNHHNGQCSTEITYLFWYPDEENPHPKTVQITGSWHQWQSHQQMEREVDEKGDPQFELGIGLPVGSFQYKFIVDGVWTYRKDTAFVPDPYGGFNNVIEVLPKTAVREYNPHHDTKISSSISMQGLKIVGSWDDWKKETQMDRVYNNLKGCYENIVYLQLQPNIQYEFKFKYKNQFLVDENYPTTSNQQGSYNNYLYVKDVSSTPTGWKAKSISNSQGYTYRVFEWEKIQVESDVSFNKHLLEGHSMCQVGEYVYTFGGRLRNDYTNILVRSSIHRLNHFIPEEIVPNPRAFHHAVAYGSKMLIYGGHSKSIFQDCAIYDTNTQEWQNPPPLTGKFPQKSENKSMVIYEDFLVLFGGYHCSPDFEVEVVFNEIEVIDIKLMKWIDHDLIKVSGEKPEPRYLHSAAMIGSDMYIFGGKCLNESNLNDLWVMNLETVSDLCWEAKKPKGKPPSSRHGHSCNSVQNFLIIFGGKNTTTLLGDVIVYDSEKNQWVHPIIRNPELSPSPRAFHASTTINQEQVVLFGGKNKSFQTTSVYVLKPKHDYTQTILDIEEQDFQQDMQQAETRHKRLHTVDIMTRKSESIASEQKDTQTEKPVEREQRF